MDQQKISMRYIDKQKLRDLLIRLFGPNNSEVEVVAKEYYTAGRLKLSICI
jgi:hypothetical protein